MIKEPYIIELENIDKFIKENKNSEIVVQVLKEIKQKVIENYRNLIKYSSDYFIDGGYYNVTDGELIRTNRENAKYRKVLSNNNALWLVNDGTEDWDMIEILLVPSKRKKMSKNNSYKTIA